MNSRPGLLDQVVRWMLLGLLLLLGVSVPSWAESILIEKSCHGTKLSLVLDSSNRMIAPMDIYRKRMLGLRDSGSGELLWKLDFQGMGIATDSWEWLGDVECGSEEGEAFVFALTYSIDHFKGRLYQARLDEEIPNEASSSDEAQGFEISSSGGPIGEFEGSAGLFGGGVVGVSTLRVGPRILSHIEIKVGEYYSGRLYLFDFDGSSPIEIKLQRGRTKSRRGLGDSPFFGKRFVSMPVPWDWIKDEEPSSKELKGKEQASFEHTTDWFSCSEIRDCTSALDSCGLLRGVRRDAEALYSGWVENEHEGDCFSQAPDHDGLQLHLPSRPAPECIPAVGCFEGRCEVRFFKEGEARCEF